MNKVLGFLLIFFVFQQVGFTQTYSIPEYTKRIVFLGNSITYNGKFVSIIDTYLSLRYPEKNLEIINVGLPSETVSGLSEIGHADGKFPRPDLRERLDRVLKQLKPDLVIANYGMNDGIYLPFDEERFEAFKKGIAWMHQTVESSGAEIIHVTPPIYDDRKGAAYANVLDIYSDWLVSLRYTQNWNVIDLHWPMRRELEEKRSVNAEFAFAKDGIHPDESGHFLMAKILLSGLGENVTNAKTIEELLSPFPKGMQVLTLIEQRQEIQKLAWLSATGHLRPGIPTGLLLEEAQQKVVGLNLHIRKLIYP
ncbi:MAG: SGNH/GDSL hydrolase family protein [Algoriphagus sp.]|nr:SGNH/GDSL hydrolase family protein [Algoriphagus sp.]